MSCSHICDEIMELARLDFNLYNKDFLLTSDKTDSELMGVLLTAEILRGMYESNISTKVFESGLAVSQFRDKSTRTRFSFFSATNLLGLALADFDEGKSQVSHGETVRETSNMISFLTETIGIRDDMFIGKGHTYMKEVASSLQEGYEEGVLPQRPTVVNLQCDIDHPTQTMSDLLHLVNYFGGFEELRGKKIAMTWAYSPSYGKPLSVPQGVIMLMTRFGMDVTLAYPKGYDLMKETIEKARENARLSGGKFTIVDSMEEAFKDADVVYPKSWAPYEVMERRTKLYEQNDTKGLEELEKECLATNAKFKKWECDEKKMKLTRDGEALYMHCLPADISGVSCKEGEVSAKVFEKYRLLTYVEARYKPFVIASMILTSRFRDVPGVLDMLYRRNERRVRHA